MEDIQKPTFSKWRQRLWPIHNHELKKLFPLILIKFFISVNYGILTILKDTLVVTSKGSGAEVIPVLKGWVVLPCAMLVALAYSKLSNILNKRQLFYTVMGSFLFIIFLYGFVLYPNVDTLSPHASSDWLISKIGHKYEHWVAVYRNWIQSLIFVTAELWGSMIILVLFWGFANDITSVSEAKRSYNIYIAAGDLAAFSVGPLVCYLTKKFSHLEFTFTVQALISIALLVGAAVILTYWWTDRYILKNKNYSNPEDYSSNSRKKKEKLSLMQGFKYLAKDRYLLGIAVMVIGYGFAVNLIEVTWKASLKMQFPNPVDYQYFTSKATSMVGLFAFLASAFLGSNIIRRFGWHTSAQLTPAFVGITGIVFFLLILNQKHIGPLTTLFGTTPLMMIVLFGAFQNIASKVAKYSFFDTTKEMAYIPLDEEAKVKGKAAIDVVGSRLGKSGSSWIQVALIDIIGTGSILSITHLILPIVVIVVLSWVYSVRSLSHKFDRVASANS
ncbi:MAG: NTP/NDP exchange transporter [Chlamydiae bacterium]|nr:NTP/NDP exchange transporter [Chlamydiota bacterium]